MDRQGWIASGNSVRGHARFESARRVFKILDLVSSQEKIAAKALARELGVSLSTCYYLINILIQDSSAPRARSSW